MKKTLLIFFVLGLFMAIPAVSAQEDECFRKGGLWDTETEQCTIQAVLQIEIQYPTELMEYDFIEDVLDEYIQQRREEFLGFFGEGAFYPTPGAWFLGIDYELYQFSEDILSVNFIVSDYTGGAHPNSYFATFTFDLAQEKQLTLEDIFVVESAPFATLYPIVEADLKDKIGDYTDPDWLQSGTGENPANYQNFVLTETSIIFLFPPYQVAAYAAGPQTVEVPLADLNEILAPPFVR